MSAGRLRFFAPTYAQKERDEELALFRELFKREREKNANLLDSVSAELEPVEGNSAVFKISSSKKVDSVTHENEKNDYDWLKTPPATPLFQSLEMDFGHPNSLNMVVHKELPIIPVPKPSRLSEMVSDSKTISTSPSSQSAASIFSPSSSRPESPDPNPTLPTMTPRLGGARNPPLRFVKESDKEVAVRPFQTRRFSSQKDEEKLRPKSPGSLSVASSASSQPETPISTPKPPSLSLSRATPVATSKEDSNPIERSTRRFSKEAPANQKPGLRSKIEPNQRPSSPSSRSVASSSSSRPETPDSNAEPKSKGAPKPLAKPVKKSIKDAPTPRIKQKLDPKPNSRTIAPVVQSRLPKTVPGLPSVAPQKPVPSKVTVSASATAATRSRPGIPSKQPVNMAKDQRPAVKDAEKTEKEEAGNDKKGGVGISGVVIGSSMVEKMLNARKSTAGMVTAKEKVSKNRGM